MSIGNLKDSGNQGNNFPWQLKVLQGLQAIFDEAAQPLTCVEDSVTICPPAGGLDVNLHDGAGTPITSTTIGSDTGVDVNIIGGVTLEVNLDAANDQVGVYGYTNPADPSTYTGIKTDASGVLAIQDNGGSITVDGTVALDSATLTALENITVQNGAGAAAVNIQDGGNSITTDTTQLPATLGQTNMAGSVSVTLANNQLGIARTPGILRPTAAGNVNSVAATFYSVSIANVGAANGTVLASLTTIKPGEVLNFSADAVNNYFTTFAYDATGTEFIIIYVS